MNPMPGRCPVCNNTLTVTRLQCGHCGTGIDGAFTLGRLQSLTAEQVRFVEVFIKSRGKIKDMEDELGISYPTVVSRLNDVVRAMGYDINEFYRGVGCKRCRNTGYSGRVGIHELLIMDDELRDAIVSNPSISAIREIAQRRGMVTLKHDGFRKVREGITTIEEVLHAAGEARDLSTAPASLPIHAEAASVE